MKTEEILQENKLIAGFMTETDQDGQSFYPVPGGGWDVTETGISKRLVNRAKYHESWDWLMSVVEKIGDTGKGGGLLYGLRDALLGADIDIAFAEVIGFIKWYNEQKS